MRVSWASQSSHRTFWRCTAPLVTYERDLLTKFDCTTSGIDMARLLWTRQTEATIVTILEPSFVDVTTITIMARTARQRYKIKPRGLQLYPDVNLWVLHTLGYL